MNFMQMKIFTAAKIRSRKTAGTQKASELKKAKWCKPLKILYPSNYILSP